MQKQAVAVSGTNHSFSALARPNLSHVGQIDQIDHDLDHDLDHLDPNLPLRAVVQDLYSTDLTQDMS